ncbi:phosphotransferase [Amycolatopsis sp. cmx-11-12]|uniref:phosphotransferase n=1 Tax=Amycolatopsis sp. cmx-11-12 TaxID=2785795 RepID=UPI0039181382
MGRCQGSSRSTARDRPSGGLPWRRVHPNTLLHDDGTLAAHVDLGSLGVADRWADLAVAAWSLEGNYGPGFDGILYDTYGITPDPERIPYYRLLYDLA